MQISGKIILFVEEKKGKENTLFKTFSTTISNKKEDGSYINKSLEVRFNEEKITRQQLNQLSPKKFYVLEVADGWLSVRSYVKDEETRTILYLYIDEATIKEAKDIKNPKGNDLPF